MSKKKDEQVMEDHGPWIFTEDQIQKIKMFNRKAVAKFFEDNKLLITCMAKKFILQRVNIFRNYSYFLDDLINQVYVDLPYYNFSSRSSLFASIVKGSFLRVNDGGITFPAEKYISSKKVISYDAPLEDNKNTSYFLDTLASTQDVADIYLNAEDREKKDAEILAYLEKTIPNKKDLNKMFVQLFTDIPLSHIKGDEYECYKQRKIQDSWK